MVKHVVSLCLLAGLLFQAHGQGQPPTDLERRVAELEEKMRLVDPAFGRESRASDLSRRIELLEKKMAEVHAAMRPAPAPPPSPPVVDAPPAPPPVQAAGAGLMPVSVTGDYQASPEGETRLPVAGYMDFHVNKDAGEPFRPDFHRFVLLFGHSFSERIKFWSELEVEHALIEGGEESGEVALEQAYLDFLIKPAFNLRAGMMLTPVGIVNERHEPPSFNGVERPFVETTIIPTTWRELGFGFTGDLGRGFRYRAYLTSSLDASRFDAEGGITGGRTAGFDASLRNPAKVARVEYAGVRRLTLGTSVYSGHAGFNTPGVNPRVTIGEFDGRYSFRRLDLRGLFANTWISRAGDLNWRLEQNSGVNPNIARQMRGYYFEPGIHVLPRRTRNDVILFGRYEKYNTQHRMPDGYTPLPQFNRSSWVTGVTYKPNADVAIKFDYVFNRNASAVVRPLNGINLGIGWWF
ncbi:MAG: hypothetical protein ACKV22_25055 [Bryobacteraceae bacterium]